MVNTVLQNNYIKICIKQLTPLEHWGQNDYIISKICGDVTCNVYANNYVLKGTDSVFTEVNLRYLWRLWFKLINNFQVQNKIIF